MIVVQITGGLGNQMFQYASAMALAHHHNTKLKVELNSFKRAVLPELEVPRNFELTAFNGFLYEEAEKADISLFQANSLISKKIQQTLPRHKRLVYTEGSFAFDKNFFKSNRDVYLKGHRQSEKYFVHYKEALIQIFQLKRELVQDVADFANRLTTENSVAVHIRRGDYLRLPIILDWHGVLSKEYYFNSLQVLVKEIPNLKIYYFSDDPQWVENELLSNFPGTIVSGNISKDHYHDFHLIQSCRNQIVANSSFSWWAAWLNPNPNKIVIAPKKWFNNAPYDTRDLIPDSWIKL